MKLAKSFLAVTLALLLALCPLLQPMDVSAAEPDGKLSLSYRYGTNNLIQVNTNLPSDTPCVNFTTGDNGCSIDQSGNTVQWIGWVGMDNVDGTIVLTFHYNNAFTAGQSYVLPKGAIFGFTDGKTYSLDGDYTFTFDGSAWAMSVENNVENIELGYRYGAANLIQFNTNLPATTPIANFLASDNGSNLLQSGNQQVGWIGMANADGTIVLTFNFNSAFEAGQSYTLGAGSVFGFTDGNSYVLSADVTFHWDGSAWTEEEPVKNISLAYRYGAANLIQYNTNLPASTPIANFLASDNGSDLKQDANQYQQVAWIGMENVDGTIVLTFHFNSSFTLGQSYIVPAGSVFGFTDGNSYVLPSDMTLYWDGSAWTAEAPHVHDYVAETTPADCENDGKTVYTCSTCGDSYEEVIPAGHTIEYVAEVIPANCQEEGHSEYWYCAPCGTYFGDAEGSYQINPAWINYTGEHVRPEGAIVCAVVPCELCGEDSYGESCDRGDAPVCQDAPCVNCGETVWGWGCNYNTGDEEVPLPLCQPGDCVYCGTHYEKIYDCENGSWAACLDGECSYGCGKQFPATESHTVTVCDGGTCQICWNTIEAVGHNYTGVVTAPTATKEGFTTYTCSGCGDSYVDDTVPALGIGELKFASASLVLKDNLNVKFNVSSDLFIEDAYSAPYVVFNVGIKTQTVSSYSIVDGNYVFTCTNLAPSQLGDTITATLYATLDGEVKSFSMEYGVATYCYNMLGKTEDAKLRTLLVDLLNYGAAAQTYAWYKDKTLCNAQLTEEQKAWGTSEAPALSSKLNTKAVEVENAKATWKAASLVLNNGVTMRFRFAAESTEGLTVKIVGAGQEWTVSQFTAAEQAGQYYADFSGLSARQMREVVSVTVMEGDTAVSNTLNYSVETYAYNKQNVTGVGALVKAMITYGDSAAAYLN